MCRLRSFGCILYETNVLKNPTHCLGTTSPEPFVSRWTVCVMCVDRYIPTTNSFGYTATVILDKDKDSHEMLGLRDNKPAERPT